MTVWRNAAFAAGSLGAHVLLAAALVAPWPTLRDAPAPQAPGTVEVVMVQQPASPPPAPEPTPASAATPATQPARPVPPAPVQPDAIPAPPPILAAARPAPPAVNLGGDPSDPWNVRSDTLKPPAPDARYRNLPPRYPPEAAARGEAGTVDLLVHVAPDGSAAGADILQSSGFDLLDREARRAVLLWHFDPASRGGEPVAFDFPISLRFVR